MAYLCRSGTADHASSYDISGLIGRLVDVALTVATPQIQHGLKPRLSVLFLQLPVRIPLSILGVPSITENSL